eukprot:gnl/TRDRNA2_/TRDRNA2_161404_c1_seq1.p1 gnl/TRDRNA2_/TRDRNA2_161404_c1~~gnl/TRDRNA2_/TRDRNA2_161404_c1_seq1.p1  ORF type:complete len:409 (+),score=82.07 gnl/TRDRNA2_/TRDRNA2_161404_c1_seq1:488-1714(+)
MMVLMTTMVILNAVLMGLQVDWMCENMTSEQPTALVFCDFAFCAIFSLELIWKLCKQRASFFTNRDERKWNLFEAMLVLLHLFEVLGTTMSGLLSIDQASFAPTSFVRLLRILRLLRVLRLLRLFKFVEELNAIVKAILHSLSALCWTLVLLVMLIYIMGILFAQIVFDHVVQYPGAFEGFDELAYWWGSFRRSLLSLYEAILGGADWDDIVFPLIKDISPLLGLLFLLYISFTMLAMMNVITGIFVESALESAQRDKDADFSMVARDLFLSADRDGDGSVSWEEFLLIMANEEFTNALDLLGIDPGDAQLLFKLLDNDNSGEIEIEELLVGLVRLRAGAKFMDIMKLIGLCEGQNKKWLRWATAMSDSMGHIERSMGGSRPSEASEVQDCLRSPESAEKKSNRETKS